MPTKRDHIAEDATAQRLLNLAFIFNTTTRPLTTDEIIGDSDLGYGSGNRDSEMRKFRRDRQKLAEQGIEIVCPDAGIVAENEASTWVLDRGNTFAAGGVITADDASVLAEAIDEYLSGPPTPLKVPLTHARTKIAELAGVGAAAAGNMDSSPAEPSYPAHQAMLDALWLAFSLRRELRFSYTNARGEQSRRSLCIYGIFTHEGACYAVGLDDATSSVRTFRTDRMERALRPGKRYEIPPAFNVHEHLFLPFDFGADEGIEAAFSFPPARNAEDLMPITHGRGSVTAGAQGERVWTVRVRDLDAAAAFALNHARDGMRPAAPSELVDRWRAMIGKAVAAHVAR